jgi:hypothetical protein
VNRDQILKAVAEAEQRYDLPRGLLAGLVWQESGFNPAALRRESNGSVSVGLTQVNSVNFERFGIKGAADLINDPVLAIDTGAAILAEELKRFSGDPIMALVAYNGGAGTARKAMQTRGASLANAKFDPRKYAAEVIGRAVQFGYAAPSLAYTKQVFDMMGGSRFVPLIARTSKAKLPDERKVAKVENQVPPEPQPVVPQPVVPQPTGDFQMPEPQMPMPMLSEMQIAEAEEGGQAKDTLDVVAGLIADTVAPIDRRAQIASIFGKTPEPEHDMTDVPEPILAIIEQEAQSSGFA